VTGAINFDGTISIGDLLTVATVLLSLATLLYTWGRERKVRRTDRANAVRAAATSTLAKLERWEELALFFYEEAQPLFIDVSNALARDDFDLSHARDVLWKGLTEYRVKSQQRILQEDIELAYVSLQVYDSKVYEAIHATIARLRELERQAFRQFLEHEAQDAVFRLEGARDGYEPAVLGNALRAVAGERADALRLSAAEALSPIRSFLLRTVSLDDDELLHRRVRRELIEHIPPVVNQARRSENGII
jgi:hypothetical protein